VGKISRRQLERLYPSSKMLPGKGL